MTTSHENLSEFESRISYAQMQGEEWLEADKKIIEFFNRKGLGGQKYFIYKNIKVCERGTMQDLMKAEQDPRTIVINGKVVAEFDGRN